MFFSESDSSSFKEIMNLFIHYDDDLSNLHSFWNRQFITKIEFIL